MLYVDDSTFSYPHHDASAVSRTLTNQYEAISKYMSANRLVINDDKTQFLVLGKSKDYGKRSIVRVNGGLHEVKSTSCEKI